MDCGVPRAAGVSGVVEPLKQLGVGGHAHFDQVGMRLHPERPEVTAKQKSPFSTKPITANTSTLRTIHHNSTVFKNSMRRDKEEALCENK